MNISNFWLGYASYRLRKIPITKFSFIFFTVVAHTDVKFGIQIYHVNILVKFLFEYNRAVFRGPYAISKCISETSLVLVCLSVFNILTQFETKYLVQSIFRWQDFKYAHQWRASPSEGRCQRIQNKFVRVSKNSCIYKRIRIHLSVVIKCVPSLLHSF